MAYMPTAWKKGDVLTAAKLNKAEQGIAEASRVKPALRDYEVSGAPRGTLVNYLDKEIRIMCPADTVYTHQQSGAGADVNRYYIGFKAYAPSSDVVSFKEDLAETVSDNEMYYFEGNEFAGTDPDGRKYSIIWLPVAAYDEGQGAWTYSGASSDKDKYSGWYYSVEWYNKDGVKIGADTIRINLSNETCHTNVQPFYANEVVIAACTMEQPDDTTLNISDMSMSYEEIMRAVNAGKEVIIRASDQRQTMSFRCMGHSDTSVSFGRVSLITAADSSYAIMQLGIQIDNTGAVTGEALSKAFTV